MDEIKIKRRRAVVLVSAILLPILLWFTVNKINKFKRTKVIDRSISKLETFRKKSGHYPKSIVEIGEKQGEWFYYYTQDSTCQVFYISYPSGIMDVNSMEYRSDLKTWEELYAGF